MSPWCYLQTCFKFHSPLAKEIYGKKLTSNCQILKHWNNKDPDESIHSFAVESLKVMTSTINALYLKPNFFSKSSLTIAISMVAMMMSPYLSLKRRKVYL